MDFKSKLYLVVLCLGTMTGGSAAFGVLGDTYHQAKPWAGKTTEAVVAGLQSADLYARLRYIERRIEGLQKKRLNQGGLLTAKQQKDLDFWKDEEREVEFILQRIQQTNRPWGK